MCFQLCRTCSSPAKCFPFARRYQQGCASSLKTDPSAAPSSKPYRAKYHVPTPCHILGVPPCSSTGKPLDLNMMLVWGLCWCGQHYIKLWKSAFSFPITSHTQVAKVNVYKCLLGLTPSRWLKTVGPFCLLFCSFTCRIHFRNATRAMNIWMPHLRKVYSIVLFLFGQWNVHWFPWEHR